MYDFMRPSKNVHIVAHLRKELELTQRVFAQSVGIPFATYQAIESSGKRQRKLTSAQARRIGEKYNVSENSLLLNDIKGGLKSPSGQPWSPPTENDKKKLQDEIKRKAKKWGNLGPEELRTRVTAIQVLLGQYDEMADYFKYASFDNPHETLIQWMWLFILSKRALIKLQDAGGYLRTHWPIPPDDGLSGIIDDIRAVKTNVATWTTKAAQAEKASEELASERIKRSFADRYGWNDSALVAYELAKEIGFSKAEAMQRRGFDSRLNERLKEKGLRPLYREVSVKECFEAIRSVYEEIFARGEATNA
jgi:DNA-binding XRE family transcriptional regulator